MTLIRPIKRRDVDQLAMIAENTGLFPSDLLPELVADFLAETPSDDLWLCCEYMGQVVGFCFARPEEMTDGTWNMLALAVMPEFQRNGLGKALVRHLEKCLEEQSARILLVDTSGADAFAATRTFYARQGYVAEARVRNFWAEGDDKVIFTKPLQ